MILRTWKARTTTELEPRYLERVREVVLPYFETRDGFRGAHFGRRDLDDGVEILVITLWESMEAVHSFSGKNGEGSYMPREIAETLTSYDASSGHFESLIEVEG